MARKRAAPPSAPSASVGATAAPDDDDDDALPTLMPTVTPALAFQCDTSACAAARWDGLVGY